MTKFVVRAITGGTGVTLAVSGKSAQVALDRAKASKLWRKASAFLVFERSTGNVVLTGTNHPGRYNPTA